MERISDKRADYVDSNLVTIVPPKRSPSVQDVRFAFENRNFECLGKLVIIPGIGNDEDVLFKDDTWTNRHLIKGKETYRKARFVNVSNRLKLELKLIGLYLFWFSSKKAKVSSIIRIVELLIVIAKFLEERNIKSLFWLDREPIRDRFISEFSEGRSDGTVDNYFKALSRLCDMKMTLFGKYEFFLNTNFIHFSPGRSDNQHYCMPMRILNLYWKSYADYFLGLNVKSENWRYLGELPSLYRKYLKAKGIKHHNNTWLFFIAEFCQDDLKKISQDKTCSTRKLVQVRTDEQVELYRRRKYLYTKNVNGEKVDVPLSTYNRRYPKYLVDMEEIYTFYNRNALLACESIQAFTGMRASEATTITYGSLIDENDWVGVKANLYKYADEGGVEEWWAGAPIIKVVFEKMRALGEGMFRCKGKELNKLFIKTDARRFFSRGKLILMRSQRTSDKLLNWSHEHNINISKDDLKEFWKLNPNISDVNKVENHVFVGATWPISSHQYWRSIAVHVKRLELVSMNHLAVHLKHLGKTIAEWYSEGALANSRAPGRIAEAFAKELEKAELERAASLAIKFQEGNNLYGKGGELLEKSKVEGSRVKVYQSYAHALSLAKRKKSKVMSLGNGMYCMNGQDCDFKAVSQSSNCRTDCENLVADKESIPIWLRRFKKYRALYADAKLSGLPLASQEFFRLEMETYQQALEFYGVICE